MVANSIATVYVIPVPAFEKFAEVQRKSGTLLSFLTKIMSMFSTILKHPVFPRQWVQMNLLVCKAALKLCRILKSILDTQFSGATFNKTIWTDFFNLTSSLLTAEALQLETFSPTKEKLIIRSYSDMRLEGNTILKSAWEGLGTVQAQFVPSLVGNFVEVSMTQHKVIRTTATNIIYSMMEKQYNNNQSLQ